MKGLHPAVASTITEAIRHSMVAAAHQSPRCVHVKANGVRCGSPAMRHSPFCYFHDHAFNGSVREKGFPLLEDANAIQIAIMRVISGLHSGTLDPKTANSLLYGLQTAIANLKRVNFEPLPHKVVTVDPVDAYGDPPPADPADGSSAGCDEGRSQGPDREPEPANAKPEQAAAGE